MPLRQTKEENAENNRVRCRSYYVDHKVEVRKRKALHRIKTIANFPRKSTLTELNISLSEVVAAFDLYRLTHTPSEFAKRKYQALLDRSILA